MNNTGARVSSAPSWTLDAGVANNAVRACNASWARRTRPAHLSMLAVIARLAFDAHVPCQTTVSIHSLPSTRPLGTWRTRVAFQACRPHLTRHPYGAPITNRPGRPTLADRAHNVEARCAILPNMACLALWPPATRSTSPA